MRCLAAIASASILAACNTQLFVHDGVTDGDTFHLADRALTDDDPVLQSWVAYSLAKSACQLDSGAEIPPRHSSYGCEFTARSLLLDTWAEQRTANDSASDEYLDGLAVVREAGYLDEYVVHFFGRSNWQVPAEVDRRGFRAWRIRHLRGHRAETRLIGSWGYPEKL